MKICLCFIGLQRTISKTYQDIQENVIDNKNKFTIVYVTWKNENIDDFLRIYPDSIIHRVDEVKLEDEEFNKWKIGLNMHISWRRTYNSLDEKYLEFQKLCLEFPYLNVFDSIYGGAD